MKLKYACRTGDPSSLCALEDKGTSSREELHTWVASILPIVQHRNSYRAHSSPNPIIAGHCVATLRSLSGWGFSNGAHLVGRSLSAASFRRLDCEMRCVYLHKRGLNAVVHNYLLRLDVVSHMTLVVYPSHVVADTWEGRGGGR